MHLCDPLACTESNHGAHTVEETQMQAIAIAGLKSLAADVLGMADLFQMSMRANPAGVSPLVGDCLYFAATIYAYFANETGATEMGEAYHTLRGVLEAMGARWAVAHQYLALLDESKQKLYADCSLV